MSTLLSGFTFYCTKEFECELKKGFVHENERKDVHEPAGIKHIANAA